MANFLVILGVLVILALISGLLLAGVWKYWRKSTIARIAQGFTFLSLGNIFFGDWEIALGGFLIWGSIWLFSYRKMNFAEKIDYETFFRR
jgi:hypothetical protein